MTELEKKLMAMSQEDWNAFISLLGPEALMKAKIRMLRREGRSYHEISICLHITPAQVRHAAKKSDKIYQLGT